MTTPLLRLTNTTQHYAWGSHALIARLRGAPVPSPDPEAEVWMGAHPKAPSRVDWDGAATPLDRLLAAAPEARLGAAVARRYDGRLPFLMKLLAAGEPLSIQAHPSLEQAAAGYARENAAGIPLDAPQRNYKDANHKPEILCALTPFSAMAGFREPAAIAAHFAALPALEPVLACLQASGWQRAFAMLMTLPDPARDAAVSQAVAHADSRGADPGLAWRWVLRLQATFPGDIGVLAPLYLHVIELQPGQAIYQAAQTLHAYLEGLGVELMANSDNVLRGGCTVKHVDVPELLRTLQFSPSPVQILEGEPAGPGVWRYRSPAPEFSLSRLLLDGATTVQIPLPRPVELLVCVAGAATLTNAAGSLTLTPGQSAVALADAGAYSVSGPADVYRASVPAS